MYINENEYIRWELDYNENVITIKKSVSYDQTEWLISTISEFCNTCIHYKHVLVRSKQFYLVKLLAMPKNQLSRLHLLYFCKNILPSVVRYTPTRPLVEIAILLALLYMNTLTGLVMHEKNKNHSTCTWNIWKNCSIKINVCDVKPRQILV